MKPEDFPIGSLESRAAARSMLEVRDKDVRRLELVTNVLFPDHGEERQDRSRPHATPWTRTLDGGLMRILYVPSGMTADEARAVVDCKPLAQSRLPQRGGGIA